MEVSQRDYDRIHHISWLYGYLYFCEICVNLIWYLYVFMLNKFCLSLSLGLSLHQSDNRDPYLGMCQNCTSFQRQPRPNYRTIPVNLSIVKFLFGNFLQMCRITWWYFHNTSHSSNKKCVEDIYVSTPIVLCRAQEPNNLNIKSKGNKSLTEISHGYPYLAILLLCCIEGVKTYSTTDVIYLKKKNTCT